MKLSDKQNANIILKRVQSPLILLSSDFNILDINATALKIYKWQKKNVLSKNYLDLCKESKFSCPLSRNKTKLPSGKPIENIKTEINHKNTKHSISWVIETSLDTNNNTCFVLIGTEIVDIEKEQNELLEKISTEILNDNVRKNMPVDQQVRWINGFLDTIISRMPGYVYWKSTDFIYLGCNDNLASMLGFKSRKKVTGVTDYLLAKQLKWNKSVADEIRAVDNKIINGTEKITSEETFPNGYGKTNTLLTNKTPIKDENNNIIGIMGVSIDITEHRKMEQELRRAKQLQEKTQNAKIQGMMEIAAGIAHEIRTPLTSIQCATDAKVYMDRLIAAYDMAEKAGLPVASIRPSHMEGLRNIFNSIDAEAKESMQIIDMFLNNLKSMVKEANTGDYQLCSIKEAVSGALARYPFDKQQKKSVVYSNENDFKFYGVNLLVQHIIFNLMKNALHYINDKPGTTINIRHEQGDTDNFLCFKDTGPGISEYDQEHVFDFGFSKRKEGSGFGLTYCKTTIQQMGGDIAVHSELGKYTEFVLTFPKVAE